MTSPTSAQPYLALVTPAWISLWSSFLEQHPTNRKVARSLQSPHGRYIRAVVDQLLAGRLTNVDFLRFRKSPEGKALASKPDGQAIIGLVEAVRLFREQQWSKAISYAQQTAEDRLTKPFGILLLATLHEVNEEYERANSLIRAEDYLPQIAKVQLLISLAMINVTIGMSAVSDFQPKTLESRVLRLTSIDSMLAGSILPSTIALNLVEAWLSGHYVERLENAGLGIHIDSAMRDSIQEGVERDFRKLDEADRKLAIQCLEDFRETFELLSISDASMRWDRLSMLIGQDWPEGLSAVEAVRAERQ